MISVRPGAAAGAAFELLCAALDAVEKVAISVSKKSVRK